MDQSKSNDEMIKFLNGICDNFEQKLEMIETMLQGRLSYRDRETLVKVRDILEDRTIDDILLPQ